MGDKRPFAGDEDATLPPEGATAASQGTDPGEEATIPAEDVGARGSPPVRTMLERGATLGRYVVLDRLGAGGMGIVYAAYDPELDRKLAVKLLHLDPTGPTDAAGSRRSRLLREAQAMARLSHPNVVTVHDVGTVKDDVFVAMEFVDGKTLSKWLRQESRSYREILDVFMQAGRGLAAAHAADLIHRDFKPENVMVAADGRVLVLDFGLARAASDEPAAAAPEVPTSTGDLLATPLTRTGALMGTPAYMSPEQYSGAVADARSDQFSFSVALYEGLYGERPFGEDSVAGLATIMTAGKIRKPTAETRVPPWLRRAVLRGLRPDPGDRYPTMNALLRELGHDPARSRRRVAAAAGVVGLVAAGIFGYGKMLDRRAEMCSGGEKQLVGIWDEGRRAAIEEAFSATGKPFAGESFTRAAGLLDDYSRGWTAMHREACEATQLRGEQSAELLDLRMACLRRRLADIRAVTDVLETADEKAVVNAAKAVAGLAPLADCADAEALTSRVRPPSDPTMRAEVDSIEEALAAVKPLMDLGKYPEGLERAKEVFERASATEHPPIVAEAGYLLGVLQWLNGDPKTAADTIAAAYFAAAGSRDDALAAEAAAELVTIVGADLGRQDDAYEWGKHSEANLRRLDRNPEENARLQNNLGTVLEKEGKFEEALACYERSLAVRQREHGDDDVGVANAVNNIALLYEINGKYDEARAYHERALAIREKVGGPAHPEVGDSHNNLGMVYQSIGEYEKSREHLETALRIWEKALGPDHLSLASGLNNLGATLAALGRDEEALESYKRALAIRERVLPPDHALIASALKNIGMGLAQKGEEKEARETYMRALAIQEKALGPEHAYVSETLIRLADLDRSQDDMKSARKRYERAIEILDKAFPKGHGMTAVAVYNLGKVSEAEGDFRTAEKQYERGATMSETHLGPTHPQVSHALVRLGHLLVRRGRAKEAIEPLERALSIREGRAETSKTALASVRFTLAEALWDASQDRVRARTLAEQARDDYEAAGSDYAEDLGEVKRWLARHAKP